MQILFNVKNILLFVFLMPMAMIGMDNYIEFPSFIISREAKLKQKEKESKLLIEDMRNSLLSRCGNPMEVSKTIENIQKYETAQINRAKKDLEQDKADWIEFQQEMRLLIPADNHQPATLNDLLRTGRHQELSTE